MSGSLAVNRPLVVSGWSLHLPGVPVAATLTAGDDYDLDGPYLGGYMILSEDAKSMTMSGRVCGLPVGPGLPVEDHDQKLDWVITPQGVHDFKGT